MWSLTNTESTLSKTWINRLWGFLWTGYLNVRNRANVLFLLTHKKVLAVWAQDVEAICEGKSMPPKLMRWLRLISHPIIPLSHTAGRSWRQYSTHLEHREPVYLLWGPYPFLQSGYNKTRIKNSFEKSIIRGNESATKLKQTFQTPALLGNAVTSPPS